MKNNDDSDKWYQKIAHSIEKSETLTDDMVNNFQTELSGAGELKKEPGLIQDLLKNVSEYSKDTNKQVVGVTWEDKTFYELYKLCSKVGYDKGKDFFKTRVTSQGFVILAGKDLVEKVDDKLGQGFVIAKSLGGMIKDSFDKLLDKTSPDDKKKPPKK